MRLRKWDPFRGIESVLNPFALSRDLVYEPMAESQWAPAVDITEDDKAFYLKVELPEIKKEDVSVKVDQGVLTLSGERHKEETNLKQHRIERYFGQFSRSFTLPEHVLSENIDAEFKDGMLYLTLPKASIEEHKPLAIDIH